jgi:hypothetical protein
MTRKNLVNLSYLSLISAIGILLLLVFAENLQVGTVLQDRVFYILLIFMGLFSSIALFGYLKSTATINGKFGGVAIQVTGPGALALIIILGGFYLIPRNESFDVTILAVNEVGLPIFSDRKAVVILKLPTGIRQADFTKNGQATLTGVPYSLFNSKQKILVDIYTHKQLEINKEYTLSSSVIEIKVGENPKGTPEGILNKKKAHLEVLKLLAPYKLILAESGELEFDITQYYEENLIKILREFDLSRNIDITNDEKYNYFDVLYENTPEYLNFNGKTYAELIHESAINFRRNVSILSQIDSEGMSPEIQRELIKISRANFVVIASSERPGSVGYPYITDSYWDDFSYEIKRISNDNVLNFFTEFSDF